MTGHKPTIHLDANLAVLVPGSARAVGTGIAVSSRVGPLLAALAERTRALTVVAYNPPAASSASAAAEGEYRTDTVIDPSIGNVSLLSLGPPGTARDVWSRRRHVNRVVDEASQDWDVLLYLLVNRRAGEVHAANRCPRVAAQIGGFTPEVVLRAPMRLTRKVHAIAAALVAEATYFRIARSAGLFFANGEELVRLYRRWVPHAQLLRSSARSAAYTHVAVDRLAIEDELRLVFVGRISAAKGIFDLVDALDLVRATVPRARLEVVGSGEDLAALRAEVDRRRLGDSVTFHGWLSPGEALYGVLRQCDVLILPSWSESLPKVIWEAQAHSVLVVATAVGSVPAVFRDEHDLLLVEPGDPAAIARAILRYRSDPDLRRRVLERGRHGAEQATVETVAQGFLAAFLDRWPDLRSPAAEVPS